MIRLTMPMALAGLLALSGPALAAENAKDAKAPREAYIPFADNGGIWNWTSDDDQTVYFQDRHRQWYKAKLFSRAFDLPYTVNIGIDSGSGGRLDKWSAIYVAGRRYPFQSFEKVDAPPAKAKKADKASKADKDAKPAS